MSAMLEVRGLGAGYGAQPVLSGVSLDVGARALVVLVGANGAGKSTLLGAIPGWSCAGGSPRRGDVTGESISGRWRGMVLVPEGRRLFGEMTVRESGAGRLPARARERRSDRRGAAAVPALAERLGRRRAR